MPTILAMDAGGTSTRAVVLDTTGLCLGYGRAGTGNPTAAGIDQAIDELALAAERAIVAGEVAGRATTVPDSLGVVSLAGSVSQPFVDGLTKRLSALGVTSLSLQPDLLGTYYSGTIATEGTGVIVGTGAVAGRISDGALEFTRGGTGWLLGDDGSGFWIGQRVARAVIAALDGLAPATKLTELVLAFFGIEQKPGIVRGRPSALIELMEQLYALRPVDLARLAPFAFEAAQDQVARGILEEAAVAIGQLLASTRSAHDNGPVVLGGSILAAGVRVAPDIFARRLTEASHGGELIAVADGVVGAAVLGLRQSGVVVDEQLFARLRGGIATLSDSASSIATPGQA
ncbi:MAG: BadF/BadG/BcrA/BcrD ATPase family protein [Lacisediminihabitans sp.]